MTAQPPPTAMPTMNSTEKRDVVCAVSLVSESVGEDRDKSVERSKNNDSNNNNNNKNKNYKHKQHTTMTTTQNNN